MVQLYSRIRLKSLVFVALFFIFGGTVKANNYYVTTVADTGVGSLRAAIDSSNLNAGLDSIVLQLSAHDTIYLLSPIAVTDSLVISGLACQNPGISGGHLLFNGAAIIASSTTKPLTLNYLNFFNCIDTAASAPGGAVNAHILHVNYCYFSGNEAFSNSGSGKGGAIDASNVWVYNSTFSGNTASNHNGTSGSGGAIYSSTLANIYNCTFSFNNSGGSGGAVVSQKAVLSNCTIVNNSAGVKGGGYLSTSDSVTIANSIIWGNTTLDSAAGVYFAAPVNSGGCNVLQGATDNFNYLTGNSDISGTDPMLDTLGYFSGCVPVVPIFCGSVAQGHASCNGATTTDAEGIAANGVRDAGAFEITRPGLGNDTIDSIQHGTTADLLNYFNTTGLVYTWYGNFTDSTQVDTGIYTIIAYNYLGCADTATVVILYSTDTTAIDTITGVSHLSADNFGFSVFPNPAVTEVNVRITQTYTQPLTIKLFDATGQVVLVENKTTGISNFSLDISGLSDGLYYLQIRSEAACKSVPVSILNR